MRCQLCGGRINSNFVKLTLAGEFVPKKTGEAIYRHEKCHQELMAILDEFRQQAEELSPAQ